MEVTNAANGRFSVVQAREHIKALVRGDVSYDGKAPMKLMSINGTPTQSNAKPKTIKTGQKIFYPFWDRAITANFKGKVDYVEVPMALSNKQIRLYQFSKDKIKEKPDEMVAAASLQRLIVYKDKKGQIGQRLLTYIPDKEYVREHGYEVSKNNLGKLKPNFFGYIEYKNWSGDIVSVLRIENGKAVRRYKITKASKEQVLNLQPKAVGAKGKVASVGTETSYTMVDCHWETVPVYGTVCETIDDGKPNDDILNEVKCNYEQVGEEPVYVCGDVEVPDPDPCPWGNCDEGNPCPDGDCGTPNPCSDCEQPDPDPCDESAKLARDPQFKQLFSNLKNQVSDNKEHGYLYTKDANGNVANETTTTGLANTGEIRFNVPDKIDGYIHSHYTGLLPVFSFTDLEAMAIIYKNDKMNDPETFATGVVTASGTQYLLFIDDIEKFKTFANDITRPGINGAYEYVYKSFKVDENLSPEANEKGLLSFLSVKKSGLALMKGTGSFDSWERKILSNNNTVITNPCK